MLLSVGTHIGPFKYDSDKIVLGFLATYDGYGEEKVCHNLNFCISLVY